MRLKNKSGRMYPFQSVLSTAEPRSVLAASQSADRNSLEVLAGSGLANADASLMLTGLPSESCQESRGPLRQCNRFLALQFLDGIPLDTNLRSCLFFCSVF